MSKQSAAVAASPAAQAAAVPTKASLLAKFAARYNVDPSKLATTLKSTCFKQPKSRDNQPPVEVTDEQLMALLIVADQYGLNPFTKEIYAFPDKGGITPIVSVDGWIRIINERPELRGISFAYPGGEVEKADYWVECTITRSDRNEPITIREYFAECYRDTIPWNTTGRRMNRHKALIQCSRVAFGFAGIFDPDEAERIRDNMAIAGEATEVKGKPATAAPQAKAAAPLQLTQIPVDELLQRIYQLGVPMNEFCAEFEIGEVAELPLNQVQAAREYLDSVAAG